MTGAQRRTGGDSDTPTSETNPDMEKSIRTGKGAQGWETQGPMFFSAAAQDYNYHTAHLSLACHKRNKGQKSLSGPRDHSELNPFNLSNHAEKQARGYRREM